MVGRLRRVLLCDPAAAGWDDPQRRERWHELNYVRPPDGAAAKVEHAALRAALAGAGVEVLDLPASPDLSLDAVYTHDASLLADDGIILLNMGKAGRRDEPAQQERCLRSAGVRIAGSVRAPGTAEGGDLVWLGPNLLLAGRGYRTNGDGIAQLQAILAPQGVEVVAAPLPHAHGPQSCLHLMSLMSLLDERTALVDLTWLAVETVELLRKHHCDLVPIEPRERDTLACNVLSLGAGRLIAFQENPATIARLRGHGFEVIEIPGRELGGNGGGGPTCLTRPLLRA